ncbi:hypothetical protein H8959_018211 [Pygathrix nigripes]
MVVNVTDANTHRPVFQSSHYTVNEDRSAGTTVVLISATDEDTDTGAVTTQAELDYEDQVSYTLAITARDNGIPQKSDTTYLEILVNNVNDVAPQFLCDSYQGSVYEDVPPFTSVLQISATDRDSGLNGRVFYTFQGGDDGDGDFIVESTSGIVRTLRRLDRENVAQYVLRAYADEFDVFVEENSPIGLAVARVTATDSDEGTNAQIMYQIVEGNIPEVFQLDIFSGELTALVDLDYEDQPEYVLVIQATVPSHDPDISDSLTYSFERGNELSLVLLNASTGELKLSRALDNNRPLEAIMSVLVSAPGEGRRLIYPWPPRSASPPAAGRSRARPYSTGSPQPGAEIRIASIISGRGQARPRLSDQFITSERRAAQDQLRDLGDRSVAAA